MTNPFKFEPKLSCTSEVVGILCYFMWVCVDLDWKIFMRIGKPRMSHSSNKTLIIGKNFAFRRLPRIFAAWLIDTIEWVWEWMSEFKFKRFNFPKALTKTSSRFGRLITIRQPIRALWVTLAALGAVVPGGPPLVVHNNEAKLHSQIPRPRPQTAVCWLSW